MASDRHTHPDERVDERADGFTWGRTDGIAVDRAPTDRADEPPGGGAGRAGPDRRGVLSEVYRDDPDDIFAGGTTVEPVERAGRAERRRMGLDDDLDGGRTARDFLDAFDPGRVNRVAPDRQRAAEADPEADPEAGLDADTGPGPDAEAAERVGFPARPASLEGQERCVRRVYAAFGGSGFHGAERHEGSLDDQDHRLRLVERQDPAQPDQERRARGMDAFKKGNGKHVCAESSTSICDPVAYAVALVRGIDHPTVRAALDARHDPPRRPYYVQVPIVELLGESGDEFCRGRQLVGVDPQGAVKERDVWAKTGWKGKPRDGLCPPQTEPITTFRDGVIEFRIGHNAARDGYELISMFPRPRRDRTEGSDRN